IGKSANLRQRITEHKKFYLQARDKPRYKYYYPRYEYAAAHGCKICWITCSSAQSAKNLEDNLLITFANYYKAKPVANNQQAWI
ncbi:MAG: hypothetical protein MUO99_05635, partial [Dehalococcoidales bacterium]|nr:hypothetical protein [Dehalococcoidales bacterium]